MRLLCIIIRNRLTKDKIYLYNTFMSILVSGSLAYDHIMNFQDRFKNHIVLENIHILNVSFPVDKMKRSWGGTAGNIAYNIKLLGEDPIIVSAVGKDGDRYLRRLRDLGIKTGYIIKDNGIFTASCYVTTDMDDNQISAFYNGPSFLASKINIAKIKEQMKLAIISPMKKEIMLKQIEQCRRLGIKVVFDPGQQITDFSSANLRKAINSAYFVIGNDYEIKLMEKRSGWTKKDILKKAHTLITTLGAHGSLIENRSGQKIKTKACPPKKNIDPTGAGDAYRGGFFAGYEKGFDLRICMEMGSVTASYAVETPGTQDYFFTKKDFVRRYKKTFDKKLPL